MRLFSGETSTVCSVENIDEKFGSADHSQATAFPVGKTCSVAVPLGHIVVSFEVVSPTSGIMTLTVCVTVSLHTPCATSVYVVVCVGVTLGF